MAILWLQVKADLIVGLFLLQSSPGDRKAGCTIIQRLISKALRIEKAGLHPALQSCASPLNIHEEDELSLSRTKYQYAADVTICDINTSVNKETRMATTPSTETEDYKKARTLFYNQMTSGRREVSGSVASFI